MMTDYLVFWTDDQGADRFTFTRANTREEAESSVPGTAPHAIARHQVENGIA